MRCTCVTLNSELTLSGMLDSGTFFKRRVFNMANKDTEGQGNAAYSDVEFPSILIRVIEFDTAEMRV